MAISLQTVVKQLEDSGIIAPGKLENFVPPKAQPKDAGELIAALVKEKQLTKFQAAQIAAGRAKSLLIGGYTILDRIGAGGMGQVFKAEHRRMKRVVAIKTLPAGTMKDAAAVARFQREVEAAAKLRHTNIVAADDADEAGGVHFLVMEYVEGQDLSELVKKNGPLPLAKALDYVRQAACGLAYAHGEGVIHRDIKPANLLVDKKGTVKILDMGLARIESGGDVATQAELTGTGAVMGTIDYMAPEQALSTKHVDARADVYSLGCTLHYLLTGRAPYTGETLMARLLAHREAPIPNLDDVPAEVEAIFRKLVAKEIGDRYQSMSDVIADLEQVTGVTGERTGISRTSTGVPSVANELDSGLLTFLQELPTQTTRKSGTSATPHLATRRAPAGPAGAAPQVARGQAPRRKNKRPILFIAGGTLACVALVAAIIVAVNKPAPEPIAALPATPIPGPSAGSEPDRRTAERVLALGGKLWIAAAGNDHLQVTKPEELPPGAISVHSIHLQNTKVTDDDLQSLAGLSSLLTIELSGTKITGAGLAHLRSLTTLTKLYFSGTPIDDAGLAHLYGLKSLTYVYFGSNPKLTAAGIDALQQALPNCQIEWNDPAKPTPGATPAATR